MNTTLGVRRTAYVVWGALLFGVLSFAAVASFVGPGFRRSGPTAPAILAEIALALAVVGVLGSRLVPARLRPPPGVDREAFALTRNIVAAALCEGPGLFGIVAWMLTGGAWAVLAVAIAVAGLVACFPGEARWRALVGDAPPSRGTGRGPSRMVR